MPTESDLDVVGGQLAAPLQTLDRVQGDVGGLGDVAEGQECLHTQTVAPI